MRYLVGVDTGGTFTDLVAFDPADGSLHHAKVLTDYASLVDGAIAALGPLGIAPSAVALVRHGTTHVINSFVQRSGARTALVTTRGFRDLLEIARANRPSPFDLQFRRAPPLVPRDLCFEVDERLDARGEVVRPLDLEGLGEIAARLRDAGIEAVAVSFLNAYLNPAHERAVAEWLRRALPELYVTAATDLSREWFEYERTSTAVANAYVGPRMRRYLRGFVDGLGGHGFGGDFYMMGSNGGVMSCDRAEAQPIALVESGPIGGCIGAAVLARALGLERLVAFDMGGTTAKCALVENGRFDIQPSYFIGGYERGFPVRAAVLDIVEVGAGGGSIAAVSPEGRLTVGPRSAGSEPGPACFGRGGVEPTVTDANLLLGRISVGSFLDGALRLDATAAHRAVLDQVARPLGYGEDDLGRVAEGIVAIATTTMAAAIKEITVERGRDLRDYALFAFGGGGPLHAAGLARALHLPLVIVPPRPGTFAAMGMLAAAARVDDTRTLLRELAAPAIAEARTLCAEMERDCAATLRDEFGVADASFERHIEMRYKGQKHPVRLPLDDGADAAALRRAFERAYRRRYGHADADNAAEIVGLRVTASAPGGGPDIARAPAAPGGATTAAGSRRVWFAEAGGRVDTAVWRRDDLPVGWAGAGPAVIEEYGATTLIGPLDRFEIGRLGEIRIHCGGA